MVGRSSRGFAGAGFRDWLVLVMPMKELLKALKIAELTPLQHKMVLILYRVNGLENALLFVRRGKRDGNKMLPNLPE